MKKYISLGRYEEKKPQCFEDVYFPRPFQGITPPPQVENVNSRIIQRELEYSTREVGKIDTNYKNNQEQEKQSIKRKNQ